MKQGLVPTAKAALSISCFLPRGFSDLPFGILADKRAPAILMQRTNKEVLGDYSSKVTLDKWGRRTGR